MKQEFTPAWRFSHSELKTFKRCRRKWWLQWYRGLQPHHEEVTGARATGNRIHRALQDYYTPESTLSPRDALETEIARDREVIEESGGIELPELESAASLERAMLEGYLEWVEETGVDEGMTVVAPEQYVEAPIGTRQDGTPVLLIGKIDVRIRRNHDQARLFMDHKTVGSFSQSLKGIRQSEQMLHYHLLEWLNSQEGERTSGALYNMLRKVKRTASSKPPYYHREEVHHNEQELRAYHQNVIATVRDIFRAREALDSGEDPQTAVYPNRTFDCSWDCDFIQACPMFDDGSRAEDMIKGTFTESNPLRYYGLGVTNDPKVDR